MPDAVMREPTPEAREVHFREAACAVGPAAGRSPGARRYFFAAGFVLSCFGFMVFLSFFCELLPLPMVALLLVLG
jgi:hypothetical protein